MVKFFPRDACPWFQRNFLQFIHFNVSSNISPCIFVILTIFPRHSQHIQQSHILSVWISQIKLPMEESIPLLVQIQDRSRYQISQAYPHLTMWCFIFVMMAQIQLPAVLMRQGSFIKHPLLQIWTLIYGVWLVKSFDVQNSNFSSNINQIIWSYSRLRLLSPWFYFQPRCFLW